MVFRVECEVLRIKAWGLRAVNIANTGYYSLVINLIDYDRERQKLYQDVASVTSIIYEPSFRKSMEAFRLRELRHLYRKGGDPMASYGMCYYLRGSEDLPKPPKKVKHIIKLDKQQAMLSFDPERAKSYVNFGEMEGMGSLQTPLTAAEID